MALYTDCSPFGHSLSYPPYRTEESLDGWLTTLVERGYNLVTVAEGCDDIVGHVVMTPEAATEPELGVFVHPEYRRGGVATEVTRHAIAHSLELGYSALLVEIGVTNKPALGIATSLGFEFTEDIEQKDRFDLVRLHHTLDRETLPWTNTATGT